MKKYGQFGGQYVSQEMKRVLDEIGDAFKEAKKNKTSPTIIEFIIPDNINVLPMVKPGNTLDDMVMEKGVK